MTDETTVAAAPAINKFALVVTRLLDFDPRGLIQGFPIYAVDSKAAVDFVNTCLADYGGVVPVVSEKGELLTTVILGPGFAFQIQNWAEFEQHAQATQAAQREAAAAAQFGIKPPVGGRRPQ